MSTQKPTSIDLILADTDDDRIYLEKKLGVTQEQMVEFFYARFFKQNCFEQNQIVSPGPAQTSQQRLDAVRAAIQRMKNAMNKP